MTDFIPRSDSKFNEWQSKLMEEVSINETKWKVIAEVIEKIVPLQKRWESCYSAASNVHNRTEADVTAKNEARKGYEKELRMFIKGSLAYNPLVTDTDRNRMGLTVSTGSRTAAPAPVTAPVGEVDFSVHLRHNIHFRDSHAPGRAKPPKVYGCEIWSKTGGDEPVNVQELTFLAVDTKSPFTVEYRGDQRGQTVWYWLRWINTRGDRGPWSAPVSAVIA